MQRLWVSISIAFVMTGCGTALQGVRPAQVTEFKSLQAQLTPADEANIAKHCPFGRPIAESGFEHGKTVYVTRDGYSLEHSSTDKVPLWVCEAVAQADVVGTLDRGDNFRADPKLAEGERSELSDYKKSGFDRGHLAPAGNQTVDEDRKDETFFLSNMAPQEGKKFNQSIWRFLEEETRDWVKDGKLSDAHMITGILFYDANEDDASTADGQVEYSLIGKNKVAVPTHFFKIVVGKFSDGTLNAVAFLMANEPHVQTHNFSDHLVSIDFLESRSGFNFMPDLDPLEEQRLERQPSAMWFQ